MDNNRRHFFRTAGRFLCLSALVGGTSWLALENRIALNGCGDNRFCSNCAKLDKCSLKPAEKERADAKTSNPSIR